MTIGVPGIMSTDLGVKRDIDDCMIVCLTALLHSDGAYSEGVLKKISDDQQ